jgi:hypothetical protein
MQYFAHDAKQSAYLLAVLLKYRLTRYVVYLLRWTDKSRPGEEVLFRFFLFDTINAKTTQIDVSRRFPENCC